MGNESASIRHRFGDSVLLAVLAALFAAAPSLRAANWTLPVNGTMTDGEWTLAVYGPTNALVVRSPSVTPSHGVLDLAKPVDGGTIVSIAQEAFWKNASLVEVRLPDTLVQLGRRAFCGCTALTNVVPFLPASTVDIRGDAFDGCSKLAVELFVATNGASVSWGSDSDIYHFADSGITGVTFGDGVASIKRGCFQNCKALKRVKFGRGLTLISRDSFKDCSALETVEPLLPPSVTTYGATIFENCVKLAGEVFIGTNGAPVDFGADRTGQFHNCKALTAVTLGSGVTAVPANCFQGCTALRAATLADSVESLGGYAFDGCTSLETVTPFLPSSLKKMGSKVFNECSRLTGSLVIPDGIEFFDSEAGIWMFRNTAVTSAVIGSCSVLPAAFFARAPLRAITLNNVASLDNDSLYGCTAARNVWVKGDRPSFHANAFRGWNANQCIVHIPGKNDSWMSWANSSVSPWSALSTNDKTAFQTAFPGERKPYGRAAASTIPASQWVAITQDPRTLLSLR